MILPLTIKELSKLLDDSKTYVFDYNVLSQIASKSNGTQLNALIGVGTFNELFDKINDGFSLKAIATNASVNIVYASTNEVASDDFRAIELGYLYKGSYTALTLSKFASDIFLDNKTIKSF